MMSWLFWLAVVPPTAVAQEAAAEAAPEMPNAITVLHALFHDSSALGPYVQFLHHWENEVFAGIIIIVLTAVAWLATRRVTMIPGKLQNAAELVVEQLDELVHGIVGHAGRQFTPFVGTLFLYIITMNVAGMVPGLKSPTSNLNMTVALAICVFGYVQYTALRQMGGWKYLYHLLGEPKDPFSWVLGFIILGPLELFGEFIKPASLALRLAFNITAEDAMLGFLLLLGAGALAALHSPIGIPLHALFYPLALLFSSIQALVFSLLTSVYLSMKAPHAAHHEPQEE